jgi:hypothetical protein
VLRPVFVEGVVFFVGHVGHGLLLFLFFEQRQERVPALHGMKHLQTPLINYIIHNFQQIRVIVKPYQQVFLALIFKYVIVLPVLYGMTDTRLSYAFMFECGRDAFDDGFHTASIPQKGE